MAWNLVGYSRAYIEKFHPGWKNLDLLDAINVVPGRRVIEVNGALAVIAPEMTTTGCLEQLNFPPLNHFD